MTLAQLETETESLTTVENGSHPAVERTPDKKKKSAPAVEPAPVSLRVSLGVDGRLFVERAGQKIPVEASRCFPWSYAARFLSLRDAEGKEVMLIRDTADLDEESRRAAEQAMAEAGFAFDVLAILDVREEFEIFSWTVQTEQGPRQFQTARDEWPRELPNGDYVVRDVASDLYVVRDPDNLDPRSRAHFWEMVD